MKRESIFTTRLLKQLAIDCVVVGALTLLIWKVFGARHPLSFLVVCLAFSFGCTIKNAFDERRADEKRRAAKPQWEEELKEVEAMMRS